MIRRIIHIDEEKCNGCGGLQRAAETALKNSGKFIPLPEHAEETSSGRLRSWQVVTISRDGRILDR